ncbi:MAG: COX15/CtaA family protein [Deltaproteobacteria bacterium]|nr:COX15/CtaA family protein [Deltaproteobacteria bacterium]
MTRNLPAWVRPLALAGAALTVVLIGFGGMVTNTDNGLACPDWPTCFGEPFPKLVGGVLMEHGHRYVATAVGFICVLLVGATLWAADQAKLIAWSLAVSMPLVLGGSTAAAVVKHRTNALPLVPSLLCLAGYAIGLYVIAQAPRVGRIAQALLLLVMTQGIFGGATVIYKLPVTVLVLHLATSMIVLAAFVMLWSALGEDAQRDGVAQVVRVQVSPGERALVLAASGLVYLQLVLGAAVRHTGAGLICTDLPLCRGAVWPTNVHPAVHLHMLHRALGLTLLVLLTWLAVRLWTRLSQAGGASMLAVRALPLLVLAQVTLGVLTIWTLKELFTVTGHLVVGALVWAACVTLSVRVRGVAHVAAQGVAEAAAAPASIEARGV